MSSRQVQCNCLQPETIGGTSFLQKGRIKLRAWTDCSKSFCISMWLLAIKPLRSFMNMVELSMHAGSQAAHMREMVVVKVDTGMVIKEEGLGHRHPRCSCAFYELESKVTEQFSGRTHQGLRGVAFMVGACSLLLQSTLERAATQLIALNPPKLQREAESSSCRHVGSRSEVCLRGCSWGR